MFSYSQIRSHWGFELWFAKIKQKIINETHKKYECIITSKDTHKIISDPLCSVICMGRYLSVCVYVCLSMFVYTDMPVCMCSCGVTSDSLQSTQDQDVKGVSYFGTQSKSLKCTAVKARKLLKGQFLLMRENQYE